MKKVISWFLMLCLLLPGIAFADVQSQVNAPAHVTDTFQSNTGKTVIQVDAEVIVPNAERVPIYGVALRHFTLEEMDALCDTAFGRNAYDGDHEIRTVDGNAGYVGWYVSRRLSRRSENASFYMVEALQDGQMTEAESSFARQVGTQYSPQVTTTISKGEGTPRGCTITAQEAAAQADALVQAFAPDFALAGQGIIRGDESTAVANGKSAEGEAWILFYTRALSLPVTCDLTAIRNTHGLVTENERLLVIVNDTGIIQVDYKQPHQITQVLQEDCTLLPVEQIMQIAASVMPLIFAYSERYYADIRIQVSTVRLGYMRVMRQDAPGEYAYTPVWDFFGTAQYREKKGGKVIVDRNDPFISLFTINAIDGTVIDRSYGY